MDEREKQIDELAKTLYKGGAEPCGRKIPCKSCSAYARNKERPYLYCSCYRIAENLYEAGYRKQVQGVWKTESNGVVVCSNCGEEHEWDDYRPSYCEDCGARMKDDREV